MRKVYVSTEHGIRRADLVESEGDWAVTIYDGRASITHLPTGARLPTTDAGPWKLAAALLDLNDLPRFHLQTWDAGRDAVKSVLAKHGLVQE